MDHFSQSFFPKKKKLSWPLLKFHQPEPRCEVLVLDGVAVIIRKKINGLHYTVCRKNIAL